MIKLKLIINLIVLYILLISVVLGDHNDQNLLEDTLYIIKFYGFKQYNGTIYKFFQTPQTPEVGRIKEIKNDFSDSKDFITINRGKGPGEAQGCSDFFKFGELWYVFDSFMNRFNCYDSDGNFIDTFNLQTVVSLDSFFEYDGTLYAVGVTLDNLYVYRMKINNHDVELSSKNSITLGNSYHTYIGGIVYSGDSELLIVVDNTLYSIDKNNDLKISKKIELGKHDNYYPVIINRNEKCFIYYYAHKYYKYDYEKNKITKVDKPGYEGSIVINGEKWIIKKENGKLVKYHINGNQR